MIIRDKPTFTIGRSNVKVDDFTNNMDKATDSTTEMSKIFAEDLLSYDHISQLGTDYLHTIKEAHR